MKEILGWSVLSGIFLLGFVTMLVTGMVRKSRRKLMLSAVPLLLSLAAAAWAGWEFAHHSYGRLSAVTSPRTGVEIYTALFGPPAIPCVEVLEAQDQVIPRIDDAIRLHFRTCPQEMARILSLHPYRRDSQGIAGSDTWANKLPGDSLLVFIWERDSFGNGQMIYLTADSAEAVCIDRQD